MHPRSFVACFAFHVLPMHRQRLMSPLGKACNNGHKKLLTRDLEMLRIETFLVHRPLDRLHVKTGLRNPVVTHHLAHVVARGVCEQYSHTLIFSNVVLLDEAVCTGHRRSTAAADQEPL